MMRAHLICPCGEFIIGTDEDDLVVKTRAHLAERHPDRGYSREEILALAY